MTEIIVAVITSGCMLIGVILTNVASNKKIEQSLQTSQAVTDCKIDELTREVREHNNFAKRMPVLEDRVDSMSRRLERIERGANCGN